MNFKMIALDVDGTLLNDRYEITEQTARTVRRAHERGIRIVLCTGRGPLNAVPILEELGLSGVLITHNGAATVETPGPKLLHEFSYSVEEVAGLVEYCRSRGIHFDVCTALEMYVEQVGEDAEEMYRRYGVSPERLEDVLAMSVPIVKLTLFGSEEQMDEAERELSRMGLPRGLTYTRSGVHFIDVMLDSVSKGRALEQLAVLWSIESSGIVAMGNYYNDMDMLAFAGLGIAMENSPEPVKQAADVVTSSNNDEGVHEAIERYIFGAAAAGRK